MTNKIKNPPFDGSEVCPFCPIAVRDLFATASNMVNAFNHSDETRLRRKLHQLAASVEKCQPLVDEHFNNTMHSSGRISQD